MIYLDFRAVWPSTRQVNYGLAVSTEAKYVMLPCVTLRHVTLLIGDDSDTDEWWVMSDDHWPYLPDYIYKKRTRFAFVQIIKIDTKMGKCVAKMEIPNCPQITSLAFGGMNLDTLFVTSAAYKLRGNSSGAGCAFQISGLGVRGYGGVPLTLISE